MFLGIDPGSTGALALVTDSGRLKAAVTIPTFKVTRGGKARSEYDEQALVELFRRLDPQKTHVWIERVSPRPTDSRVGLCQFATGYGILLGIMATLNLTREIVPAATWKTRMLGKGKKEKGDSLILARRLFASSPVKFPLVKDHNRAEAALLAEYGRRLTLFGKV